MLSQKVWCVVGDVLNPEKVASRIGPKLLTCGKEVWYCNPSSKTVETDSLKTCLADIPASIDVINLIIHPIKGKEIVAEAAKLGVKSIWIQPGADSPEIIELCKQADIEVHQGCVLVEM
jgi:predicted CoA-binding protein